ncbi:MAG: hypothetical protein Q9205_007738, partial [Flavoplaca limonia]
GVGFADDEIEFGRRVGGEAVGDGEEGFGEGDEVWGGEEAGSADFVVEVGGCGDEGEFVGCGVGVVGFFEGGNGMSEEVMCSSETCIAGADDDDVVGGHCGG